MIKYIHMDCEMGGRDLKYSLLTAYFMVTDEHFKVLGDLYLKVKPDDGDYIVNGEGMRVNGIDLQEHDEIAIPYKTAKGQLYDFLKKQSNGGHLIPSGHAVKGDIAHVIKSLISEGSWHQFCTYHYIDTTVVLQFLRSCGKMPLDCDGSVGALATYFNIINSDHQLLDSPDALAESGLHDAKLDTIITAKILQKFIELGKK